MIQPNYDNSIADVKLVMRHKHPNYNQRLYAIITALRYKKGIGYNIDSLKELKRIRKFSIKHNIPVEHIIRVITGK